MSIIIYLLAFGSSIGQNSLAVDSLYTILKTQKDTSKVNTLNELAWELKKIDAKKAKQHAILAYKISDSLFFEKGKTISLNRLGTIALFQKDYNQAERIYLQVLEAENKVKNIYGIGRAQNQLSEIYRQKNDLKKALKYGLASLSNYESIDKKRNIALVSNNLGLIYQDQGSYSSAMAHFLKSLKIREQIGDKNNIGFNYLNLGILSISMQNYPKAIDYLLLSEKSFKILNDYYELAKVYNNLGVAYLKSHDFKVAQDYFSRSAQLKKKMGIEEKDAKIYNNLGAIHYSNNRIDLALENYLKSIYIQGQNVDKDKLLDSYCNIGHIYYVKRNYPKAIEFYIKTLDKCKNSNKRIDLLKVLNNLSQSYSQLKEFNLAYRFNAQYISMKDSIEYDYKKAVMLNDKYQQQQKEKEILERDRKIAVISLEKSEIENKRKNILISSLIAGLLLLGLLFFAIVRGNRLRQKELLAQKDIEIGKQKVEELLKNQELKSINAMIKGQEEERRRIARDLHDRLGSILSMVKIYFKSVEDNIEAFKISNLKQYEKANELLDNACDEVRKISHDMTSGILSKFGLVAALEDLKETLEQSDRIDVEFIAHGIDNRLESDIEITVYRIIQELISNTLKYANATELTIQLLKSEKGLNVIVEDNGEGFDIQQEIKGIGLKNINSRIGSLDGELNIDSVVGKGTTITIDIPLKNI